MELLSGLLLSTARDFGGARGGNWRHARPRSLGWMKSSMLRLPNELDP